MNSLRRTHIAGTPIDHCDLQSAVWRLVEGDLSSGALVVTPNVSIVRQLQSSRMPELLNHNVLWLLDGRPLQLLLSLRGLSGFPRATGADLVPALTRAAVAVGVPVVLLGASAPSAADTLSTMTSSTLVKGYDLPFGEAGDPALFEAAARRLPAGRCVIFLCLGFPKQEYLGLAIRRARPDVIVAGVGAAAQMLSGQAKRAPRFVQAASLEWMWRMVQEPKRLFRRYIIEDLPWLVKEAARILFLRARGRMEEYD